jgi:hypothetical protein
MDKAANRSAEVVKVLANHPCPSCNERQIGWRGLKTPLENVRARMTVCATRLTENVPGKLLLTADTGADVHVMFGQETRDVMSNVEMPQAGDVVMMNNHSEPIECYGDVTLELQCEKTGRWHKVTLRRVAFVRSSLFQLLSWSKWARALMMVKNKDSPLKFFRERAVLPLESGSVHGALHEGLYVFGYRLLRPADGRQPVGVSLASKQGNKAQGGKAAKQDNTQGGKAAKQDKAQGGKAAKQDNAQGGKAAKQDKAQGGKAAQQGTAQGGKAKESGVAAQQDNKQSGEAAEASAAEKIDAGELLMARVREFVLDLHKRIGHAGVKTMQRMLRDGSVVCADMAIRKYILHMPASDLQCGACAFCRVTKKHPNKQGRSAQRKGMWTTDISTTLPKSRTGKTSFSAWIAPNKKGVYLAFQKTKGQMLDVLKHKRKIWQAHSGEKMRYLRHDRDSAMGVGGAATWAFWGESQFTKYLAKKGIQPSITTAGSSGPAEAHLRHLQDAGLAALTESGLPKTLWPEAIASVNDAQDMLLDQSGMSRWERREGTKPPVHELLAFGTHVYAVGVGNKKLHARGKHGRLLRRADDGPGYRIYDPKKKTVFHATKVWPLSHAKGEKPPHEQRAAPGLAVKQSVRGPPGLEIQQPIVLEQSRVYGAAKLSGGKVEVAELSDLEEEEESEDDLEEQQTTRTSKRELSDGKAEVVELSDLEEEEESEDALEEQQTARKSKRVTFQRDRLEVGMHDVAAKQTRAANAANKRVLATQFLEDQDAAKRALAGEVPRNTVAANESPDAAIWRAARKEEAGNHERTKSSLRVPAPPHLRPGYRFNGKPVIGSRHVYDIKLLAPDDTNVGPTYKKNARGQKTRFKAAQGNTQRPGDYGEVSSPTPQITSIRLCCAYSVKRRWPPPRQADVASAFLLSILEEKEQAYMLPEKGDKANEGFMFLCLKAIYGLKQAGYKWHCKFSKSLQRQNVHPIDADTCVYIHRGDGGQGEIQGIIILHVDDSLLFGPSKVTGNMLEKLEKEYKMTTEKKAKWFLKMRIQYADDGSSCSLSQPDYADEIVRAAGLDTFDVASVPSVQVLTSGIDEPMSRREEEFMSQKPYGKLVGMIHHLQMQTRPDLSFSVSQLQSFLQKPREKHWEELLTAVRYINSTRNYGLKYTSEEGWADAECRYRRDQVVGSVDADWASAEDRCSRSGVVFTYMGAAISHKSKKQPGCPSRSTAEAELNALDLGVREARFIRKLCLELDIYGRKHGGVITIPILEDNAACLQIATGSPWSAQTKHVDVKQMALRWDVQNKIVSVERVKTKDNLADAMTKPLTRVPFEKNRMLMGVVPVH